MIIVLIFTVITTITFKDELFLISSEILSKIQTILSPIKEIERLR